MAEETQIVLDGEHLARIVSSYGAQYFNSYIQETVDNLYRQYGNRGYNIHSDYTDSFNFGNMHVSARTPPYTMCVSSQFEIILQAINLFCQRTNEAKWYDFLPQSKWFGLNGLTLQNCVWENEQCHSVGKALSLFGMGEILDFSQLLPGSFISYDHGSGGHSVCFLGYLDENARIVSTYSNGVAGFRFFSSNGMGTSGDGLSYRDGVLDGRHMPSGSFKQALGIRNIRGGMMYSPPNWNKAKLDYFSATQRSLFDNNKPTPPTGQF